MSTVAPPPRLRGADVGIPTRRLHFRIPTDAPRWFYGGNATASLFISVLSAAFPPGEDFFVEAVRRYRDRVEDPELRARVAGFIGQEAIHGREHRRLNDLLRERDIDVDAAERLVALGLAVLERLPARQQLAATAFMEHFTALLGEQLLTDEQFQQRGDPEMLPLWLWHALEELEHKDVTYDVYETIGNHRLERLATMQAVTVTMVPALLAGWAYLVVRAGAWRRPADLRRGVRLLLGRGGFVTRILPGLRWFGGRDFHPSRHDTTALVEQWREILFGEDGTLRDQLPYPDDARIGPS